MIRSTVIGLYGVSGSGKSRALSEIQAARPEWRCLEGSCVIQKVMQDRGQSFSDFQAMDGEAKEEIRNSAVQTMQDFRGVTVVAGHCSFPISRDGQVAFDDVFNHRDGETYKAILYLDKAARHIERQREADNISAKRSRPVMSVDVIEQWIQHEKATLRRECEKYGIYFALVRDDKEVIELIVEKIVSPFLLPAKERSEDALRAAVAAMPSADVFLLVDGDRTLCPEDTGKIFFEKARLRDPGLNGGSGDPLKQIFQRYPTYTFQAFLEVAMLYERSLNESAYRRVSHEVGSHSVNIYPQWIQFLTNLPPNVHPVLISSGNRDVWQAALERHNIGSNEADAKSSVNMSIIAGNHIGLHRYIVDSHGKALVATELRRAWGGCKIVAFGDSVVDVPMLRASDRAYIVIDDRRNRSMQRFIDDSVASEKSSRLHQLFLEETNVDHPKSLVWHPGVQVGCLERLLRELKMSSLHRVHEYAETNMMASILATQTRRSDLIGPSLQDIHRRVGRFLAYKLLDEVPGAQLVQDETFAHVQGTTFSGTTTTDKLLILPLMRGGEPMSRGVHECFPLAKMVHFWDNEPPEKRREVLSRALLKLSDVIIVDSVINEGNSVRRVLGELHDLGNDSLRVYVLTGVIQKEASMRLPSDFPRVRFLTLRVSDNKYTGRGGTDTGNRLFGTF